MTRRDLLRHPLAMAGVVVTTVSAVVFIALLVALLLGLLNNPYAALVVFIALPALFVVGLLLIPLGMWRERRRVQLHPEVVRGWGVIDLGNAQTRRWSLVILALTAVNLIVLLVAGYGALHAMESPSFCGQTCHTPMHPQFTAWKNAPHSQVECVQCHIGDGAHAFVKYKMNGTRQLYHVVTNHYPKPIPGVADMRPAHETCGTCHWAGKGFGDVIRAKRDYSDDEAVTETTTILQLHVGGPGTPTPNGRAIHWHADPNVHIEFIATDVERQTIPYVKVTDAKGNVREYTAEGTKPEDLANHESRRMDCIDCHNVVAHRISPTAEQAVDREIAYGRISRQLPYVRREAVRLLKTSHPTVDEGVSAIDSELKAFYASRGNDAQVAQAIASVKGIYRRNVFPDMNVTFGTYPDNIGHTTSSGCFRCHDGMHTTKDGTAINADCEYCHKQIDATQ